MTDLHKFPTAWLGVASIVAIKIACRLAYHVSFVYLFDSALRAVAFLNAADAQGRDNADALEALASVPGIECAPVMIVRRKSFPNAAAQGRGVVEVQPRDGKAVEELLALAALAFG